MAASFTAIATVIWSDIADAAEPMQVELADEVVMPQPVKLAKIEHKQLDLEIPEPSMEQPRLTKRKSRLNFGSFEGY